MEMGEASSLTKELIISSNIFSFQPINEFISVTIHGFCAKRIILYNQTLMNGAGSVCIRTLEDPMGC